MSDMNQPSKHGHIGRLIVAAICIATAGWLFINRQQVVDQIEVWQYQPSSDIVSLAKRTDMSQTGTFYFYATQPALESASVFNTKCRSQETSTAILGCYNGRNIFIYNVTDTKLDGIREVTAAHEMLHAAYQRMSDSEKQTVNSLLEAEYTKLKNDKDFAERMAFYDRTEPGERDNELHSVIGTEVATISPELEAHYKQYFNDRSIVVGLHTKYASVFTDLQAQGDQLAKQLTDLGNTIEQESLDYNQDVATLNNDIESFNSKARDSGGFSSQDDFDSERAALVARANQLDARRDAINNDISQYETLHQELASIASQSDALNRSINSSLAPAPSL